MWIEQSGASNQNPTVTFIVKWDSDVYFSTKQMFNEYCTWLEQDLRTSLVTGSRRQRTQPSLQCTAPYISAGAVPKTSDSTRNCIACHVRAVWPHLTSILRACLLPWQLACSSLKSDTVTLHRQLHWCQAGQDSAASPVYVSVVLTWQVDMNFVLVETVSPVPSTIYLDILFFPFFLLTQWHAHNDREGKGNPCKV